MSLSLSLSLSLVSLLFPKKAVARLTADNLVLMARLRAAEAAAGAATRERDELALALHEHKGPWLEEVRWFTANSVKHACVTSSCHNTVMHDASHNVQHMYVCIKTAASDHARAGAPRR